MKTFLSLLLLLNIVKASPVLQEHPLSLVEGTGTHVGSRLNGARSYSPSSRSPPTLESLSPLKQKDSQPFRIQGIDSTLSPWIPPVRRIGESDEVYRNRYLKAESFDRVNREAKRIFLQHIPNQEKASETFIQFNQEERDKVIHNYEINRQLRSAGLLKQVSRVLAGQSKRKIWRDTAARHRLRYKLMKLDPPYSQELLKQAKDLRLDLSTIHNVQNRGRKSKVKDRVNAFLLKYGHVTADDLKEVAPPSPKNVDFVNSVQRKPRSGRKKSQASSPSAPPTSEMMLQSSRGTPSSSGESFSDGSPFPRKKRTKMMAIHEEQNPVDDTNPIKATKTSSGQKKGSSVFGPFLQQMRTKVVKKQKLQETLQSIFGDLN